MAHAPIQLDAAALNAFCQRHGVARLLLFGSALRDDFDHDRSDIDLLVDFQPGVHRGLFKLVAMRDELTAMLGREVDLTTPGSLGEDLRRSVLVSAEVLYDAA